MLPAYMKDSPSQCFQLPQGYWCYKNRAGEACSRGMSKRVG